MASLKFRQVDVNFRNSSSCKARTSEAMDVDNLAPKTLSSGQSFYWRSEKECKVRKMNITPYLSLSACLLQVEVRRTKLHLVQFFRWHFGIVDQSVNLGKLFIDDGKLFDGWTHAGIIHQNFDLVDSTECSGHNDRIRRLTDRYFRGKIYRRRGTVSCQGN
ncbi:hypothetical protein BT63DRAFT_453421 [Microthyrium microscopicum]|uniref:Uncharacterized protein n=1 Tax=Microthyrium microscopicum TaxID=703497 RepID=A0A6A6UFS5_9PEZI|nr:hypothetical protein BT63DRAFT_453421 [Microthyrium microscopicum]